MLRPSTVSFLGKLSAFEASKVIQNSKKALLPIDDEICKFAFPSKASSYVKLGKPLVGICGKNTSVGVWINKFHLGHLVSPDIVSLREFFDTDDCKINDKIKISGYSKIAPPKLDRELDIKYFTTTMTEIIVSMTRSG